MTDSSAPKPALSHDGIARLLEVMTRLRTPAKGCPWDLEQSYATIVPYTIEEAYEVADAIERGDFEALKGELGDLLFQVVFYAQMAKEEGRFDFNSVAHVSADKMERRHPHVFGTAKIDTAAAQTIAWEAQKARERAQFGVTEAKPVSVLDDVAKALEFDENGFREVVSNIQALKDKLPEAIQKCLIFFPGVDRAHSGYEGLMAAQECLRTNEVRDAFAAVYSIAGKLWEAISPDRMLSGYEADYRWLTQVYISVQPTSGTGKLIWHALGAKTIELIHQNVHVEAVHDDLETLVVDSALLEAVMGSSEPTKKAREFEVKLTARLRKHMGNPRYKHLSERLEALKERHERGLMNSVEFLKQLLELARELVATEKETPPHEDEDRGKEALTELFQQVRNEKTPVVVERIVSDIDEIVRLIRFPGWQQTAAGEREVKKALRRSLLKYKLHQEPELFEQAYGYVCQYY